MKKIIFALMIAMTTITNVNALENISKEEKAYLNQIGYEDLEIEIMTQSEYEKILNEKAIYVSSDTKYYKTIYLNNNYAINNSINTISTEITKEEYENESSINPRGDETVNTEYKKMVITLTYVSSSNQYKAKNTLTWKKMPKIRDMDIIAMSNNSAVSEPVANTYSAYTAYITEDSCKKTSNSNRNNHTSNWKKTPSGSGITFSMPKDTTKTYTWNDLTGDEFDCWDTSLKTGGTGSVNANIKVTSIVTTLIYNLSKVSNASLSLYGSYKHGTKYINVTPTFDIAYNGSPSISVSPSIENSFDEINDAQLTITNPVW